MKQNNIEDIYELSSMQQGMLFHKLAAPDSVVYFEQNCLTLQTQLNIPAFQKAWQRVVDRHPILRTSFYWDNLDKPYQVVHQQVDLPWEFQDWRELSFPEQQKQLKEFLKIDGDRGFALSEAPLIRITLIQVADDTYEFVFSFHHILMEGWSINWLWKECYEFYNAFCQGQDLHLERPRPYKEYIAWLHQQDLDKAEIFWRQKLKEFTLPTPIITAKNSASDQKEDYQRQEVLISAEMTTALKSLARKHQLTLNILIKGAWALLLSRYSQESDIVFGSTSSGRPTALADAESMVGLFINTLPLRVEVDSNAFLTPWLKKVQAEEVQMREYEYSPLIKIQQWSEIPRGLRLFDSILVFDNELVDYNQGELAESIGVVESQLLGESRSLFDWTNYPLTLGVVPNSGLLNLSISYDIRRFDSDTISRMLGHLKTLLEEFIANPERKLRELPMLTAKESEQILQEWNNTKAEYSQDKCIHELFEAQVEKTPHAVAVVFEDQQLTYQELNTKANQLAHQLQSLGVKPEVLVGLCMQRSMEIIIGLLAILKAGGAYVPIDPTYPQQRLEMLLNDAQVSVLFTQNYLLDKLPAHTAKVICLDDIHWQSGITENPVNQTTPTNLAYVIYTSGSTGIPKGVAIQHQSLVNFVQAAIAEYKIQPQDRILQFASISFDAACEEIFPCLLNGATLVLRTDEMLVSIKAFNEKCQQYGISVLDLPTAFWHQLTSELATSALKLPESLRLVIIGGEKALPDAVNTWRKQVDSRVRLINSYGPTETTVVATICDVATVEGEVPIGRAIANMQTYLLDADLQPVPIGVWGELHIGGVGVARGYLNQPELTDQKFIPNPFSEQPGSRLYKTGDRVRYRNDGQIEFSDRIDNQVKIRGFRIELGEIEALINEHPSVREATVIARKDVSSKQLVAYVVGNTSDVVKGQTAGVDLNTQQASHWQAVFDSLYNELDSEQQSGFYIKGWESSYTGLHIPDEEVREWTKQTVERISALQPTHVLEIGCGGSGLMLLRFAPHCRQYCATDISQNALNILQQQLGNLGQDLSRVSFINRGADDFTGMSPDTFDSVFIVSVAQYFPSIDYLLKVLEGAVNVVEPGGFIFLGDVRNFSLLEAFHTSVQLYKAPDSLSVANLQQHVKKQILAEKQLVIDPGFFIALKQYLPKISHVEIHLERGQFHNELTKFRYDVVIHVGHEIYPTVDISWLDWQQEKFTLASVRQLLIETEPDILGIVNVPNARVLPDVKAVELLKKSKGVTTVDELRQAIQAIATTGVDPEELWTLSEELPYIVDISWSENSVDGQFQVVFKKRTLASQIQHIAIAPPRKTISSQTWSDFANTPLQQMSNTQVVSLLRQHLEATLPNYMMPSAFVMLDKLPLTPNGKIDRHALPAPDTTRPELEAAYQPPQTEVEKTIASIWQEILNIGDVGIHDNFFELGGHSLLLIQVHSKLQKVFQRDFTLVDMFEYPTISHLAKYFSQESSEEISISPHPHHSENRTASVQRRKQARKEHRAATNQKNV